MCTQDMHIKLQARNKSKFGTNLLQGKVHTNRCDSNKAQCKFYDIP